MELRAFAKDKLTALFQDVEQDDLYRKLVLKQQVFSDVVQDTFSVEYLAAKLAVAAVGWKACCRENSLESSENVFFEFVMQCFQSPKMANLASAFSEYMYASDSVSRSEMCLATARHMFRRLKMEDRVLRSGSDAVISPSLEMIVLTFEGFRNAFENDFQEHYFSSFEGPASS